MMKSATIGFIAPVVTNDPRPADGARQTCRDACKDQDRDAVAQPAFGDLLAEPHQEHRTCRQAHHGGQAEAETGGDDQAGRRFECHCDAERLEQGQTQRAVARVLRDLAAAGLAFLLQLLEGRKHVGHQLHDDRRRDVRHDPQREHGEARQRPAREHVEQAQNAALLALEERCQLVRVDTRHRNVRANPVDHEREQQKDEPTTEVAELACFCDRCRVSCHEELLSVRW
jgi:hypothetical protein